MKRIIAGALALQAGPALAAIPGVTSALTRALTRSTRRDRVALTFDDGPHPQGTPAVLSVLADHGVTATFFLIGEQVEQYPDVARRIAAAGHEIALHGGDHRFLPTRPPVAVIRSLIRTQRRIFDITGVAPLWYRPPYGAASGPALLAVHRMGLTPIWWTRWGRDWSRKETPETVTARILSGTRGRTPSISDRDILLLHDSDRYADAGSWRTTADALPLILSGIAALDHRVGPLTELIDPE